MADVDVTRDKPLHITDSNRTFGIVTIHPGGSIWVETMAEVAISKLVKADS